MTSDSGSAVRPGGRHPAYGDLMSRQVRHVLLVSSLYESFILAEDGHLHERVLGKFLEASPREPPDLTRVSSGHEALRVLRSGGRRVDLVVASPDLGDMDAIGLAHAMAAEGINVPITLLGYDREDLRDVEKRMDGTGIMQSFLYQGDARVLMAIVQVVEDRLNVDRDTRAGVPVFLVVEDNVRFYSSFLPVIYAEVQHLSESVQSEPGNRLQRIMRMRARPKILLDKTYEHALRDFHRYRSSIMGVFSDMQFPRDGTPDPDAGRSLVQAVRELEPEIPISLQSSHEENRAVASELGVGFLLKGSPDFLLQLRHYLSEHLFFGDFVFRDAHGRELARATDVKSLVAELKTVPSESVAYHARRHDFSRWLRARAEFGVAARLRPWRVEDFPTVDALRDSLVRDIDQYRRERTRGSVSPFRGEVFDGKEGIVQVGGGSLGGKGRGLAFASRLLDEARLSERFPGVRITVPSAVVLGTGVFDEFLDRNNLRAFALQSEDERETLTRILCARLPDEALTALERVVTVFRGPLAVRSSSLLEDARQQPLAGIYGTWLLPNDHPDPRRRVAQLVDAVQRVYATTFTRRARAFLEAAQYRVEEEAMAVIVQRLVGAVHNGRFYPHISGVARSYNYYPQEPAGPEDGIAAVALGLGRTVAEGEPCLRFSPAHPAHILDHASVESMLESAQRSFWALELGKDAPFWEHDGPIASLPLRVSEEDGTLAPVASTYSPENHAVYDGTGRSGVPLVTFAPVLKHGVFPLAAIVRELLALGASGTRLPVEIEFAATLGTPEEPAEMAFLQLRPAAAGQHGDDLDLSWFPRERVFCESPSVLGHGRWEDLTDWVVVDRERFERTRSGEVAAAVAHFNALLVAQNRRYGLIGVGRWGSSQPWLGIPVKWEDISGARVIVEAGFKDMRVTPSQGTHFYQSLVSLGVGYFTVNADAGEGFVDWEWLGSAPEVAAHGAVRLVRLPRPAVALLNGRRRRGVILKPEGM